ncbi:MAG: polyphosphate polymerase domain-containing protein [Lachnospiraceae bacterium]|nr:polyphosphate polymerase domain-containing protein [Lachnospiraceae bacterium]
MEKKIYDPSLVENQYRHEFKYLCSYGELMMLKVRLQGLVSLDTHVGEAGVYNIRSLYFDDIYDTCYRENEAGTDPREKFRIRIYDHSSERISLELKRKVRGKTQKLSCLLTEEQCRELMEGEIPVLQEKTPALLRKLCLLMQTRHMRPKVIVEYERVPYVYPHGNVRITMDENISASNRTELFLERQIPLRPILEAGQHILEVKYDEYLPDCIYRTIQPGNLRQTAFSKYYLCRRYHL